jgi:hypothetical protein
MSEEYWTWYRILAGLFLLCGAVLLVLLLAGVVVLDPVWIFLGVVWLVMCSFLMAGEAPPGMM